MPSESAEEVEPAASDDVLFLASTILASTDAAKTCDISLAG